MIEVLQSRPKITAMELFDMDLPLIPTVGGPSITFNSSILMLFNQPFLIQWIENIIMFQIILQQFVMSE